MGILSHLEKLTSDFVDATGNKIPYINIYSRPSGKKFITTYAEGEGKACVDDVARACVLAFETYTSTHDSKTLQTGLNWLKFLDYMTGDGGYILNFIDSQNKRVAGIPSSYQGGVWWTARAKYAYAKAYRVTKTKAYLKRYFNLKISESFGADVASLLFIAGVEVDREENKQRLYDLSKQILDTVSSDGYLLHSRSDNEIHLWGYHQIEAVVKAFTLYKERAYFEVLNRTIDVVVKDAIKNNFYYSFPGRTKEGLCAYCISPIARGLFEAFMITKKERYRKMFMECMAWFYGKNEFKKKIYDKLTGACRDGIKNGNLSQDCGAESSIEAGYCELRRVILASI